MKLYTENQRSKVLKHIEDMKRNSLRDPIFTYTSFYSSPEWLRANVVKCAHRYAPEDSKPSAEDFKIFAEDFRLYTEALAQNSVYQAFEINDFFLDENRAKQLGAALGQNRAICTLILRKNLLGANIAHIVSALVENETNIQTLVIDDNEISDAELSLILPVLTGKTKLKTLELRRGTLGGSEVYFKQHGKTTTTFGATGAMHLAAALDHAVYLETLKLWGFSLAEGGAHLANAIGRNIPLKKLSLQRTQLSDKAAATFGKALEKNNRLIDLNLHRNDISAIGIASLMSGITVNQRIIYLNLSYNNFGDDGAMAIAAMLKINRVLRYLNISWCGITSFAAISAALANHPRLSGLSIDNGVKVDQLQLIADLVLNDPDLSLRFINLKPHDNTPLAPIKQLYAFAARVPNTYNLHRDFTLLAGWELFKRQNTFGLVPKDTTKASNGEDVVVHGKEVHFPAPLIRKIGKFVGQEFCMIRYNPRAGLGV